MKKLLVLASLLLSTFSAHATTVVAEDTAEHTINFTFGRPSADVYICKISISNQDLSNLDTMTFPDGDTIRTMGDYNRTFTRETAPISSTLHLGSANYGTAVWVTFCHDLQVPGTNPGGQVDMFYKIVTPANWSYFTNSSVYATIYANCPAYGVSTARGYNWLSSNTVSDYTLLSSIPFDNGESITTDPTNCTYDFLINEYARGPRVPGETTGNVTIGVKDVINFN